jgi:hypothetical protein
VAKYPALIYEKVGRERTRPMRVDVTNEQFLAVSVLAYRLRTTRSAVVRFAIDALIAIAQGKPVPVTPFITDLQRLIEEYRQAVKEGDEGEGGKEEESWR